VSWEEPKNPNGEITGYVVTYETAQQDETFSKQVKQKVTTTWLVVANLEEEVTYYFSVRASTFDLGPPATGNVTTGPQEGSPGRPEDLLIAISTSSVNLQLENGPAGKGPIVDYYIESRKKGKIIILFTSFVIDKDLVVVVGGGGSSYNCFIFLKIKL
jgi:protein sidekick